MVPSPRAPTPNKVLGRVPVCQSPRLSPEFDMSPLLAFLTSLPTSPPHAHRCALHMMMPVLGSGKDGALGWGEANPCAFPPHLRPHTHTHTPSHHHTITHAPSHKPCTHGHHFAHAPAHTHTHTRPQFARATNARHHLHYHKRVLRAQSRPHSPQPAPLRPMGTRRHSQVDRVMVTEHAPCCASTRTRVTTFTHTHTGHHTHAHARAQPTRTHTHTHTHTGHHTHALTRGPSHSHTRHHTQPCTHTRTRGHLPRTRVPHTCFERRQ